MKLIFATLLVALCTVSLGSDCANHEKEMTDGDFVNVVKQATKGKKQCYVHSKEKSLEIPVLKSIRGDILIKFKTVGGKSLFATWTDLLKAARRIIECNNSRKTKGGWSMIGGIVYNVNPV